MNLSYQTPSERVNSALKFSEYWLILFRELEFIAEETDSECVGSKPLTLCLLLLIKRKR